MEESTLQSLDPWNQNRNCSVALKLYSRIRGNTPSFKLIYWSLILRKINKEEIEDFILLSNRLSFRIILNIPSFKWVDRSFILRKIIKEEMEESILRSLDLWYQYRLFFRIIENIPSFKWIYWSLILRKR